jgi:hypothetical protein
MNEYEIETKYTKEWIEQSLVERDVMDNKLQVLWSEIMDLREESVRQALIANGWTPPETKED